MLNDALMMMPWRPGTRYECSGPDLNAGYGSTVRTPRGCDSVAACTQLESAKLSARERMALRAMAMTD